MKYIFLFSTLTFLGSMCCFGQNALSFDGIDDGVNCGTDTALDVGGKALTVEAWVYATGWKTNIYEGSIVNKEDNSSNGGFMLRAGNGGRLSFGIGRGSGPWDQIDMTTSLLSLNKWHHVAGTFDGQKLRLYLDGMAVDSLSAAISIAVNSSLPLTIGYHNTTGRNWQGKIDEVRLWNVVRTASEISNDSKKEFCGTVSGLRAYYKFDEGAASRNNGAITKVKDYAGFGNDATLSNFALKGSSSNWVKGRALSQSATYRNDTLSSCTPFFDQGTQRYYNKTGLYYDTLVNHLGCDSVVVLNVNILGNSSSTIVAAACDSFISPNKTVYKTTGTYYNVVDAVNGCDSVIKIELTIGGGTHEFDTTVCLSYTVPSQKRSYQASGTYYDTLVAANGCDSLITINLTVLGNTSSSAKLFACDSVLSLSGRHWLKVNDVFTDTLINVLGCDSLVDLTVSTLQTTEEINVTRCQTYISPSGRLWDTSGIYVDTIANQKNCDSIITVDLYILGPTFYEFSVEDCRVVELLNGRSTPISGSFIDTIKNHLGCDSIITLNATVNHVNVAVSLEDKTLTAQSQLGSHQWLNCNRNFEQIDQEVSQTFTPQKSGRYAVEVKEGECYDTSKCYAVVGLNVNQFKNGKMQIWPVPAKDLVNIKWVNGEHFNSIEIRDLLGRLVHEEVINSPDFATIRLELPAGHYVLKLRGSGSVLQQKMVVKD